MKKIPYHSALKPELDISYKLDFFENNGSIVLFHDMNTGINDYFRKADVIYSEPPWMDGYNKFVMRAEIITKSFFDYLVSIQNLIKELNIPAYLLLGKHMLKHLSPDRCQNIRVRGYDALLGIWNAKLIKTDDHLEYISKKYNICLDFSCGYGHTANAMQLKNKKFICSDINKKCVYYVAKTFMDFQDF